MVEHKEGLYEESWILSVTLAYLTYKKDCTSYGLSLPVASLYFHTLGCQLLPAFFHFVQTLIYTYSIYLELQ
jgi:hypothetical protein